MNLASLRQTRFPLFVAGLLAVFLAAPWPIATKSHALLHGLCAQRLSHTYFFGAHALPFDARMTGIYGGCAVGLMVIVAVGRGRAARLPSWPVSVALVAGVLLLAVDGLNSLAKDLGWVPLYPPRNLFRLVTGQMVGVALAVMIAYMLANTLWRRPDLERRVVGGATSLVGLVAGNALIAALILAGPGFLYVPMVLFLILASASALAGLILATIVLVRREDGRFFALRDIDSRIMVATGLAVAVMVLFAVGRLLLERSAGPPTLV